jgi:transcriptional regulator with XRE-family HTH domain
MKHELPDIEKLAIDRIKDLRTKKGWTQEKLAERADLTSEAITRVERGIRMLTLKTLGKLAHGLGVSPAVLIDAQSSLPSAELTPPLARIISKLEDEGEVVQLAAEELVGAFLRALRSAKGAESSKMAVPENKRRPRPGAARSRA